MIDKNFRGNAYVVKGDQVLCEYVSGFADLPNEIPNTIETRFASAFSPRNQTGGEERLSVTD